VKELLKNNNLLEQIDIHFADYICELQDVEDHELWLLAAFTSYFANQGDSAFSLSRINGRQLCEIFDLKEKENDEDKKGFDIIAGTIMPTLDHKKLLPYKKVIGAPGELKPLVFEGELFFLNRFFQYEQTVANFVIKRASNHRDISDMKSQIDNLFLENFVATIKSQIINWQKVAAIMAIRSDFSIISGGPGTGKTTTVGKILTLLLEKEPGLVIKMVAPTGKAAERLNESIKLFKQQWGTKIEPEILDAIPETAQTIHRFLGINAYKLYYDKYSPAPIDILVIDEASMVSLPLFAKTFDALPDHCRVILLGDKDQLMAVENGNVLKDMTDADTLNAFSLDFVDTVADMTDQEIELEVIKTPTFIDDDVIQLEYSWRFHDSSGIGILSRTVNAADESTPQEELLDLFPKYSDIKLEAITDEKGIKEFIIKFCKDHLTGYKEALAKGNIAEIIEALAKFRVLCAVNDGPFGVNEINPLIEKALFPDRNSTLFYHGRPILITQNDYRLNLVNGDVGIIIKENLSDDNSELKAFFPAADGTFREFNPASLGEHRTAFTISIHKSQGSEFENVYIILPDEGNRILTKELIYTAITRAKENCTIIASPEILCQAARKRMVRISGLKEKLR
jgi:exodeoxyribonuclease V alpha subunit